MDGLRLAAQLLSRLPSTGHSDGLYSRHIQQKGKLRLQFTMDPLQRIYSIISSETRCCQSVHHMLKEAQDQLLS
jgi:hypothetical protein